jgi:hypothetical protein
VNAVYCRNGETYLITLEKTGGVSSKIYTFQSHTSCEVSKRVALFKNDTTILVFVPVQTDSFAYALGVFRIYLLDHSIALVNFIDMKEYFEIGAASWLGSSYGFLTY